MSNRGFRSVQTDTNQARTIWTIALLMTPAASLVLAAATSTRWDRVLIEVGLPGALAALALLWRVRGATAQLLPGLVAGAIGTIAYDGVRLGLSLIGLAHDPFRAIRLYGVVLAGDSWAGTGIGWTFHVWNGLVFGAFYASLVRNTLVRAVVWGLTLELLLVITVPRMLALTITTEFLRVSLIGHVFYGIGLWLGIRQLQR